MSSRARWRCGTELCLNIGPRAHLLGARGVFRETMLELCQMRLGRRNLRFPCSDEVPQIAEVTKLVGDGHLLESGRGVDCALGHRRRLPCAQDGATTAWSAQRTGIQPRVPVSGSKVGDASISTEVVGDQEPPAGGRPR